MANNVTTNILQVVPLLVKHHETISATPDRLVRMITGPDNPYYPFTNVVLCPDGDTEGEFFAEPILPIGKNVAFNVNLGDKMLEIIRIEKTEYGECLFDGSRYEDVFYCGDVDLATLYHDLNNLSFKQLALKYESFEAYKRDGQEMKKELAEFFWQVMCGETELDDFCLLNRIQQLLKKCKPFATQHKWKNDRTEDIAGMIRVLTKEVWSHDLRKMKLKAIDQGIYISSGGWVQNGILHAISRHTEI